MTSQLKQRSAIFLWTRLATLLVVTLSAANDLRAQGVNQWDGSASNLWSLPTNWSFNAVPNSSTDAEVGAPAPTRVTTSSNVRDLDVLAAGSIEVHTGSLAVSGNLTNDGEVLVSVNETAGVGLILAGGSTLDGVGSIALFTNGQLTHSGAGSSKFAQGADHSIRGEGLLYANFINLGTIVADDLDADDAGMLLITTTPGGGGTVGPIRENYGVIQSSESAALDIRAQIDQSPADEEQPTGRIIADGKTVHLNNSTIIGGTLESTGGGVFDTIGNALTLNAVHNLGHIDMISSITGAVPTMRIDGGFLTNDGVIVVLANVAPGSGSIRFAATGVIDGAGEIILNRENDAAVSSDGAAVGTNGADHVIRGVGFINATLVNEGTIIAEARNGGTTLELLTSGSNSMTNNSVMRADAGSVMRLRTVRLVQDAVDGRVVANGGTVELHANSGSSPLVDGGRLETVGAGTVEVVFNTRLHNVVNEGALNVQPNRQLTLGGTSFTNNGVATVQDNGSQTATISIADNVLLAGDGEIVLADAVGANSPRLRVETGFTATQAAGHTIRGKGLINGGGGLGTLINNGRIEGTSATDVIDVVGTLGGDGLLKNVRIGGTHAPGTATATASVPLEGSYAISGPGSRLELHIAGPTPGSGYDQLLSNDPTNVITIAPTQTTLDVKLVDFTPSHDALFTLVSTAGTLNGGFQTVNLDPLPTGYSWQNVSTPGKTIAYRVVSTFLAGDFDEDHDVDGDDLADWKNGYGTIGPATHGDGDADFDYDVDGNDFLVWQRQVGDANALPASAPLPEPSSAALALAAAALAVRSRRFTKSGGRF